MYNNAVTTSDMGSLLTPSGVVFVFPCFRNTRKPINGAYSPLNDAHYFGTQTHLMHQNWFGAPPLEKPVSVYVHYGVGISNASWNGSFVRFGDGDATTYPLATALDIVAHEVSHGVTERYSSLVYFGQSGGINEAFSDIAGEAAEFFDRGHVDWLVGAEVLKSTGALRYFIDPTLDGKSIGNAADYYAGIDVHHSSGVFNRAFYLLATSTGWDIRRAFEVFFDANKTYWSSQSDFIDAAYGVIAAASDRGYSQEAVRAAFGAVGVVCPPPDADGDGMDDVFEMDNNLNPMGLDTGLYPDSDGDQIADSVDQFPSDANWLQEIRFTGTDMAGARAGSALAAGNVDGKPGDEIIIGMPYFSPRRDGKIQRDAGKVVVLNGKTGALLWQKIGTAAGERFGYALAYIKDDGGGAGFAVGSPGWRNSSDSHARGRVQTFSLRHVDAYGQPAALSEVEGPKMGEQFGAAVVYLGDGIVAVGAPNADTGVLREAGAVYVFQDGSSGAVATLRSYNRGDHFGTVIAAVGGIVGNAGQHLLLVSSPDATGDKGMRAGTVSSFLVRNIGAGDDPLTRILTLPELSGFKKNDRFGVSIAGRNPVLRDKNEVEYLVGAPGAPPYSSVVGQGSVYLCFISKSYTPLCSRVNAVKNFGGVYAVSALAFYQTFALVAGFSSYPVIDSAGGGTLLDAGRVQAVSSGMFVDGEYWHADGTAQGAKFGWAIVAADVNNDGVLDIISSAPGLDASFVGMGGKKYTAKAAGGVSVISGKARPNSSGLLVRPAARSEPTPPAKQSPRKGGAKKVPPPIIATTPVLPHLFYKGEAGGVRAALPDIAAEAAEFNSVGKANWVVFGLKEQGGGGLRYFGNPARDRKSIGHSAGYYTKMDAYHASGVVRRAFYLLATSRGWNARKASEVFNDADTHYLLQESNFAAAACGVINAAADRAYNTDAVVLAFRKVGVSCVMQKPPVDKDRDHMDDHWEVAHGLIVGINDAGFDPDNDTLNNIEEYRKHTDPQQADTDADFITDAHDPFPNDGSWLGFIRHASIDRPRDLLTAAVRNVESVGSVLSSADIDGGGFSDTIIGLPRYVKRGGARTGSVLIFSGKTGELLWQLFGAGNGALFGFDVAGTKDINGDGRDDLLVGSPSASGAVFAYSFPEQKRVDGVPTNYTLINAFYGKARGDRFGTSVASVTPVIGAGSYVSADIVVGAPGATARVNGKPVRNAGAAYVYNAASGALVAAVPNPAPATGDAFGTKVLGIGDITGNGQGSILVSAPLADSNGKDSGSVFPVSVYGGVSYLPAIIGSGLGHQFGSSLAALGVVDDRGIPAFAIGAPKASRGRARHLGEVRVCLGQGNNSSATPCTSWYGAAPHDYFGESLAGLGAINGQSYVLVGSGGHDAIGGGRRRAFAGRVQALSCTDGSLLWQAVGAAAGDYFGRSIAVGDVNDDKTPEALIGASGAKSPIIISGQAPKSWRKTGAVWVVNGAASSPSAPFTLP